MHKSDAPGPISVKPRRPRKAAVVGHAGEEQRRLQELGDTLDGLVHAVIVGDALVDGLARRCHELWLEQQDRVLEWRPTELKAGGRLVLAADTNSGRFIWPAYVAGLRALAIRTRSTATDVMSLALRLSVLSRSEDAHAVAAFADWLWRGGALGFDAAQVSSAHELGETLIPRELDESELWAARSEQAVERWNELAWRAERAQDARARQARFLVPLEQMQGRIERGELGLSVADAQALQSSADDGAAWARVELPILLRQPELREALPSAELTRACVDLIEGSAQFDPRLFELCTAVAALCSEQEPFDFLRIGVEIARKLLMLRARPELWLELASRAQPGLVSGLLSELVEFGEHDPAARQVLIAVIERTSPAALFARVDLSRVRPQLSAALIGAALQSGTDAAQLVPALERLPAEAALAAMIAWPILLSPARVLLERLIAEQPSSVGPVLCQLVRASRDAALAVGTILLAAEGAGLGKAVLEHSLGALVEAGFASRFVQPLWDTRSLASSVRLAALAALATDSDLASEVLRARKAALLEPPEIREALEALRKSMAR